jgi:hypothetical protein
MEKGDEDTSNVTRERRREHGRDFENGRGNESPDI